MNSNRFIDFSVDKENKTVHVVREFNAGLARLDCMDNSRAARPVVGA